LKAITGVVAALVLFSACKVERTPPEYVDRADRMALESAMAVDELQDRLLALGQAISRRNHAEAMVAMAPAPDVRLIMPGDGEIFEGRDELSSELEDVIGGEVDMRMTDVQVTVGRDANVAWFRLMIEVSGAEVDAAPLRMSGVYIRREGAWALVQAHLSAATPADQPSGYPEGSEAPAADG
jgi:hypothetical protein